MAIENKFARIGFVYAIGQVLAKSISFILLPIYIKQLGVTGYGQLALADTLLDFIGCFTIIRVYSGYIRFYREYKDKQQIKLKNTVLSFAFLMSILSITLSLTLGKFFSPFMFNFDNSYYILILITARSIAGELVILLMCNYDLNYKAGKYIILNTVNLLLNLVFTLVLVVVNKRGISGIYESYILSNMIILTYLVYINHSEYKFQIDLKMLKETVIFSGGLIPSNIASMVLTLSDRYFLSGYRNLTETGVYSVGYKFGMLIQPLFVVPFSQIFTPYKFSVWKDNDAEEKFNVMYHKYHIIGCFIMLGICLYSKPLIILLGTRDSIDAYKLVPLVVFSYFLYGKSRFYYLGIQFKNKTYYDGFIMLTAGVINILLNIMLIPEFGMCGAAIATLVSYIAMNYIYIRFSLPLYPVRYNRKLVLQIYAITFLSYSIYYAVSIINLFISLEMIIGVLILAGYIYWCVRLKLITVCEIRKYAESILNKVIFIPKRIRKGHENNLTFKLKKFIWMSPSKGIKKIVGKVYQIIKNKFIKHMDLMRTTHLTKNKHVMYSYININDIDITSIDREAAEYLCNMYLSHTFDLLGSGYVNVTYDMNCSGIEGNIYNGSLHINNFDRDGMWLKKVLLKLHLKNAKKIWQDIDEGYIPIDWQMDFKSGFRFSQKKWHLDQPIGKKKGVDIKVPWELCRLQHLPQLAVFALIFPEKREVILREFKNQIQDFIMANPPGMGVGWTCTMDAGIRAANILIAFDIFSQFDEFNILDNSFRKVFYSSTYEHGNFIINNLEWNEEFVGNHYLSDICGLLFVSAYLERDEEIDSWLGFSIQEIISQGLEQFYEDGGNFEASTSYHRLSGELLVYSTALIYGILKTHKRKALIEYKPDKIRRLLSLSKQKFDVFSHEFFPKEYIERIYRAALFTSDITKDNGNISQIGDNDSGRFFKFSPNGEFLEYKDAIKKYLNLNAHEPIRNKYFDENVLNHDTFISAVNGFFEDEALSSRDKFPLEKSIIRSLCKDKRLKSESFMSKVNIYERQVESMGYSFRKEIQFSDYGIESINLSDLQFKPYPLFGVYIFRCDNFYISVLTGDIGQNGNGGHSHNDKLSFELNLAGRDIHMDPGTYLYSSLPEKRNEFRSIKSHNVCITDDEEQCRFAGLFSMKNQVNCRVLSCSYNSITIYLSYKDTKIIREFNIDTDKLIIIDRCNKEFNQNIKACDVFSNGYGKLIKNIYKQEEL